MYLIEKERDSKRARECERESECECVSLTLLPETQPSLCPFLSMTEST